MNTLTVSVVFLAIVAGTLAGPAGTRVVGGDDAQPHQFPHQISLQLRFSTGKAFHFCGGSILNESFVLTAAHCHKEDTPTEYVEVVAGEHNLNVTEPSEQRRRVVSFVIHEDYPGGISPHDIALVSVLQCLPMKGKIHTSFFSDQSGPTLRPQ
jgi:secreted trypsin-like serine protease